MKGLAPSQRITLRRYLVVFAAILLIWLVIQLLMPAGFHIQHALKADSDRAHWIERAVFSASVSKARLLHLPVACETTVVEWSDSSVPAIDEGVPTLSLTVSLLLQLSAVERKYMAWTPFASDLLLKIARRCLGKKRYLDSGPYSNASALMYAVVEGNYEIANVLVAAGADPQEMYATPHGSASSSSELARSLFEQAKKDSDASSQEKFSQIIELFSEHQRQE